MAKNSSTAGNRQNKFVLEYIDWKESYYYRQWIVRHADDSHKMDDYLRDLESQYLHKQIRKFRSKKSEVGLEEFMKDVYPVMIAKCYSTIHMIYKEALTEVYWKREYDMMIKDELYVCKHAPKNAKKYTLEVNTLENLLYRVRDLKALRREIRQFLDLVHKRELLLKQIHLAMQMIQEDNFLVSLKEVEARKKALGPTVKSQEEQAKEDEAVLQRREITDMGNNLVHQTDLVLSKIPRFIKSFNKQFNYVLLETFIFHETDYTEVAV